MIRHHITLQRLAEELSELLDGFVLTCAWSQAKDSAILVFTKGHEEVVLECDVSSANGTFFRRDSMRRARRNTLNIFESAYGQSVACVMKHANDRIVCILLSECQIHAEFFSGGSGNLVLVQNDVVTDALHDKHDRIGTAYHDRPATHKDRVENRSAFRVISDMNPLLGKWYAIESCRRAGIDPDVVYSSLTEHQKSELQTSAELLLATAERSKTWYVLSMDDQIVLSTIVLTNSAVIDSFDSVLKAIAKTLALRARKSSFLEQQRLVQSVLTKRLARLESTIANLRLDQARDSRAADYKRFGDMLMTQPDLQRSDMTSIEILDWTTDEVVVVTLQPTCSLLENAQRYYNKSRTSLRSSQEREKRLPKLEAEVMYLRKLLHSSETVTEIDQLPQLPSHLQRMDNQHATKSPEEQYRVFQIDDQHTLYVGKSAANNDQLTMKFARQQDWWLHVRGASGSHAVLRGVQGPKIPKQVLETAAAITAYYSQARNASYVPVVYTQRKYVRKPKGANIGAVVIDREQSIMVKPSLPSGSSSED